MNSKAVHIIKNFSYTAVSNIASMLISALVIFVIPKMIGDVEYGYWQLYLFYASYVGFLHFGWNDGIYLRYGGKEYQNLDKNLFFSQFYMLLVSQIIIAGVVAITSFLFFSDLNRSYIFYMVALCLLISNMRYMLLFILQATNRIKEYSQITILDKIFYCIIIAAFLLGGIRDFKLLIISDLAGKLLSLLFAMYCCKDIVFRRVSGFHINFKEAYDNISVGIKLMFATIASMLIIGVVRFGIERTWDISTFGKISLTLTISNLLMLLINAVSIVLFPILRRTDDKKLAGIYITLRDFLMVGMLGFLILYFPLKTLLLYWIPNYTDSIIYMSLVFPMCLFEGKMALLISTYLKTLRQEKMLLRVNVITLMLSIISTIITTLWLENIPLAVLSIVVILAFRSVLAEILLSRIIKISVFADIILELLMATAFILLSWFLSFWIALIIYIFLFLMYMFIKRNGLLSSFNHFKGLINKAE